MLSKVRTDILSLLILISLVRCRTVFRRCEAAGDQTSPEPVGESESFAVDNM